MCALIGLLTNSLNYDWSMFSRVLPSLARVKMRDNLFVTVGFRYNFSGGFHYAFQNRGCMVSEEVDWQDFLN